MNLLQVFSSLANQEKAPAFLMAAPFWALSEAKNKAEFESIINKTAAWYLWAGGGQWQFLTSLERLEFDSRLFGYACARLQPLMHYPVWPDKDSLSAGEEFFKAVLNSAGQQGLQFVMARIDSRDMLSAQCLERGGFSLVDVSVEWGLDLAGLPANAEDDAIRPWREADRKPLLNLAARAFTDLSAYADRFAIDPRLRPHASKLYETWLDNCFKGEQASQVLVLDEPGAGFIALRLPATADEPGWVVLNAVAPEQRGRGLYNALLLAGLHWLKANGVKRARVRTKLSQQAVIRAWGRLGGRQLSSDMSFHWWHEGSLS